MLWWSQETISNFIRLKQCIVDQYSNYTVAQINKTVTDLCSFSSSRNSVSFQVNGSQTQGENIADNGGIKEAFNVSYDLKSISNENKTLISMI